MYSDIDVGGLVREFVCSVLAVEVSAIRLASSLDSVGRLPLRIVTKP